MEIFTHIGDIPILKSNIPALPYNSHLKKILPEKRKAGILREVLFGENSTELISTVSESLEIIL